MAGVVWRNNGGNDFTKVAEGFGDVVAADRSLDEERIEASRGVTERMRQDGVQSSIPVPVPMKVD